jgi:tetratricopeptide (TPR) repeat protein
MKSEVFYRMNNLTEAFKTFDEALNIEPDDITILNNYAYYLAEHDMELKKAEAMSRKVIEQETDNATFLDTYAWVLFKKGKTKDAAKIMERIISQGSNISAEHYEHYGFILKKLKKYEKAIENWEIAMKLDNTKSQLNNEIENCRKR